MKDFFDIINNRNITEAYEIIYCTQTSDDEVLSEEELSSKDFNQINSIFKDGYK